MGGSTSHTFQLSPLYSGIFPLHDDTYVRTIHNCRYPSNLLRQKRLCFKLSKLTYDSNNSLNKCVHPSYNCVDLRLLRLDIRDILATEACSCVVASGVWVDRRD